MKIKAKDLVCKCGNNNPREFKVYYEVQVGYDLTEEDGEIRALRSTKDFSDIDTGWAHIYCSLCTELVRDLETDILPMAKEDE